MGISISSYSLDAGRPVLVDLLKSLALVATRVTDVPLPPLPRAGIRPGRRAPVLRVQDIPVPLRRPLPAS